MSAKKQAQPEAVNKPTYHIEGNHIQNVVPPTNEHTRDAIVALAKALEANAVALAEVARALKGGAANMECGLRVGG